MSLSCNFGKIYQCWKTEGCYSLQDSEIKFLQHIWYIGVYLCASLSKAYIIKSKAKQVFFNEKSWKNGTKAFFFCKEFRSLEDYLSAFFLFLLILRQKPAKNCSAPKVWGNIAKKIITTKYFLFLHAIFLLILAI